MVIRNILRPNLAITVSLESIQLLILNLHRPSTIILALMIFSKLGLLILFWPSWKLRGIWAVSKLIYWRRHQKWLQLPLDFLIILLFQTMWPVCFFDYFSLLVYWQQIKIVFDYIHSASFLFLFLFCTKLTIISAGSFLIYLILIFRIRRMIIRLFNLRLWVVHAFIWYV